MRRIVNWNQNWKFTKKCWTDVNVNEVIPDMTDVTLPHTWYSDGDYYRGDAVYQKTFNLDMQEYNKVFIQFHGVDKVCEIYLNGVKVGSHEGGYSIFAVELTPFIRNDTDNLLTVLVNNENGKTVCPMSGDFTIFGGIHREVNLIFTGDTYFDHCFYGTCGLVIRPEINEMTVGQITVMPKVKGAHCCDAKIHYSVCDADQQFVSGLVSPANQDSVIYVENPTLWDGKDHPYLYTVKAELRIENEVVDCVELSTGFRKIDMDANRGFFLNGKHLKLNGVAKHQDTAEVFSAATMEHWKNDMDLIEKIGANAVRLSHYQHPYQVYDICDQKGLVVWAEIPLLKLTDDAGLFENAKQQLTELIFQNMHHPSICFWGLQNEIAIFGEKPFMYEKMKLLQNYARSLDSSRFTTSANLNSVKVDSPLNRCTDVVAYNLYFGWYYGEMSDFETFMDEFHRVNPDMPVGISEYGVDCNIKFHSDQPKRKDYTEEYQMLFHETVYPYLRDRDYIWGTFVWNMFDFVSGVREEGGTKFRNNKGLVSHDRQICKDAFYYYRAQWSDDPFVHITGKRYVNRCGDTTRIKVYSNLKLIVLNVNDVEYRKTSENGVFVFDNIPIQKGDNRIAAKSGNLVDEMVIRGVDEADESYVYVDANPGIDVKNWFVDEVEMERLFPQDAYSIKTTINDLLENKTCMETIDRLVPDVGQFMRETIGTFTLEDAAVYAKTLCTGDQLKELNEELIKIKK